jgi:hypothetical protein
MKDRVLRYLEKERATLYELKINLGEPLGLSSKIDFAVSELQKEGRITITKEGSFVPVA